MSSVLVGLLVGCIAGTSGSRTSPLLVPLVDADFPILRQHLGGDSEFAESGFGWISAQTGATTTFSDDQGVIATFDGGQFSGFRVYRDRTLAVWTHEWVVVWRDGVWVRHTPEGLPTADESIAQRSFERIAGMSGRSLWVTVPKMENDPRSRDWLCQLDANQCWQMSARELVVTENFFWHYADGGYEVRRISDRQVVGGWASSFQTAIVPLPGDRVSTGWEIVQPDGTRTQELALFPATPIADDDLTLVREFTSKAFRAPDGRLLGARAEIVTPRTCTRVGPPILGSYNCQRAGAPSSHQIVVFEFTGGRRRELGHVNLAPNSMPSIASIGSFGTGLVLRVAYVNGGAIVEHHTFAIPDGEEP